MLQKGNMFLFNTQSAFNKGNTILVTRIDPSDLSKIDATVNHNFSKNLTTHTNFVFHPDLSIMQSGFNSDVEVTGKDFTAELKLGTQVLGLSYFQSITPRF